jgi:hypothetical protein
LVSNVQIGEKEANKEGNMNREPRRIPPKLLATSEKRRVTREVAALPKGSKEILRKGGKGKMISFSPSQPHSKTFGR